MSVVRVVLHIDRLVLRGVPEADRDRLADTLRMELAAKLSQRLSAPQTGVAGAGAYGPARLQALLQARDRAHVRAAPIVLPDGVPSPAASLGHLAASQIARSIAP